MGKLHPPLLVFPFAFRGDITGTARAGTMRVHVTCSRSACGLVSRTYHGKKSTRRRPIGLAYVFVIIEFPRLIVYGNLRDARLWKVVRFVRFLNQKIVYFGTIKYFSMLLLNLKLNKIKFVWILS